MGKSTKIRLKNTTTKTWTWMKVSFNFEFNLKCVDQVPVVIYELNESAINFISQESFEKALILLQKAQTMLEQIQASKN